jgi:hypothetical protein
MTFLRTTTALLALLLFGAHLLRWGGFGLVFPALAAIVLVFLRAPWARRCLQVILTLASLEWARTAWQLALERQAAGQPFLRMLLILAAVIALSAGAAWLAGRRPERSE